MPLPAKAIESLNIHRVETFADTEEKDADHDKGNEDGERNTDLDNQRHALGASRRQHEAIFNRATGKVLDDSNNPVSNGTGIQEYRYLGNSNQQWQLTPVLFYSIVNRASGLALDVTGGSVSSGALIEESTAQNVLEQQWQLVPAGGGFDAGRSAFRVLRRPAVGL